MLEFQNDEIIKDGYEKVTTVLICNSNEFENIEKLNVGNLTKINLDIRIIR